MDSIPTRAFFFPSRRISVFLTIIFVSLLSCETKKENGCRISSRQGFSLDDTRSLSTLSTACAVISSQLCKNFYEADTTAPASFNRTLDSVANKIKTGLPAERSGLAALDSIKARVYTQWEIRFDPNDTSLSTLVPHMVFRNRKGACLGVSLIMLMLAEKVGCPLYGVVLPGHFFCRYDDGKTRINIEPNRQGCLHDNGYYRQRYGTDKMPWYTLNNLSRTKTIGIFCYNAGTLCLNNKKYGDAIDFLSEAERRLPNFPEVVGNLALAYATLGNLDSALILFEKVFANHPDLKNCALNYGSVLIADKQYVKASDVFTKGLKYFPKDTALINRINKSKN